jgi:phenylacetate-CoA ligase
MPYAPVASSAADPCLQLAARERIESLATQMLERDRWSPEEMRRYQRQRLRETVAHAVAHSRYYREAIGKIAPGAIDLQRLPILTKSTLMAEFDQITTDPRLSLADAERHMAGARAAELLSARYRVVASSGTTGQRGIVVYDQPAWEVAVAGVLRALTLQGMSGAMRVVGIGAPTSLHMTNRLFAELRAGRNEVPRLAVTTPLSDVVQALNAYQPEAVITYPSFIRRLAEEQQAGRLRIAPRVFSSCAEAVTPGVCCAAACAWGAAVLNVYATTETSLIAVECPSACGMHVLEDLLVLEVVDEHNRPVPDGRPGCKVLVTNLFNRILPLIRYEISDIVTVAEGPCPCGRAHRRLAAIEGRREDVVSLPGRNGGTVDVHTLLLGETLLRLPAIRQYQVETRPGGLSLRVVIDEAAVRAQAVDAARSAIAAELAELGASIASLNIEAVESIDRVGTGAKLKPLVRGSP